MRMLKSFINVSVESIHRHVQNKIYPCKSVHIFTIRPSPVIISTKVSKFSGIYNAYILKNCIRGLSFCLFSEQCELWSWLFQRASALMSFKRSCHFQDPSFPFLLLCFLSQLPLYHGERNSSLNGPKSLMVLSLEFSLYSSALIGGEDKGLLSVIKHSSPLPKMQHAYCSTAVLFVAVYWTHLSSSWSSSSPISTFFTPSLCYKWSHIMWQYIIMFC